MIIDGIPNRPLYFYQKDIIDHIPFGTGCHNSSTSPNSRHRNQTSRLLSASFSVPKALRHLPHLPSLQDAAYGSQGVKFAETEGVKISSGDGTEMLDEMLRWRKIPQESTGPMSTLDELQAKTMFFSAGLGFTFGLMVMRFHDIMTIMSTLD